MVKCKYSEDCEYYSDCFVCNNDKEADGYCPHYDQLRYEDENNLTL